MIRAVAFCPMAPVLIPDVAQGAAPELDDLRAACRAAIARAAAPDRAWIVLGPGESTRSFSPVSRGTLAGFGVPCELGLGSDEPGPIELPLSLTVGASLLRDAVGPDSGATGWSVPAAGPDPSGWHAAAADERDLSVLVMGDGSARRTLRAPGYLDERAEAFDATVERALRTGSGDALAGLDAGLGAELLAAGVPAWRAVAPALAGRSWAATLHHVGDPYGVAYFAASWVAR